MRKIVRRLSDFQAEDAVRSISRLYKVNSCFDSLCGHEYASAGTTTALSSDTPQSDEINARTGKSGLDSSGNHTDLSEPDGSMAR